jgi:hypothetical protein
MENENRIRERAHHIWEEEGRPEGKHREHWERACREDSSMQDGTASGATTNPGAARGKPGSAKPTTPTGNTSGARQGTSTGATGLVGADDVGTGVPDAMGVDDLNTSGRLSDPADNRPTTGRSKLVGT